MRLTVDASVFVSASMVEDAGHHDALRLRAVCEANEIRTLAPVILLAEVAAAIARGLRDSAKGEIAVTRLLANRQLVLRQADSAFAIKAARLAARYFLGGADALYVALARETRTTLVTGDREIVKRTGDLIRVMTPSDWLKEPHR